MFQSPDFTFRPYHLFVILVLLFVLMGCEDSMPFYSNLMRVEQFRQLYDVQKLDILWVLDNSESMKDRRDYVRDHVEELLRRIGGTKAVDYRMAVTTTDYGTPEYPGASFEGALVTSPDGTDVVRSGDADPIGTFMAIVDNIRSSETSYWEQGRESAMQAISRHGGRFLRPGVELLVVLLSDEDSSDCAGRCWGTAPEVRGDWDPHPDDRYASFFRALVTARGAAVSFFPVIGIGSSSCSDAAIGTRYLRLLESIDSGVGGSICPEDIGGSLHRISYFLRDRATRFPLRTQANVANLTVTVDGVEIPYALDSGYSYEPETRTVVFAGGLIPPLGATIQVAYRETGR